ncbi:MAG: clostripain-related cysteine peptidase [Anaerolineae bacterium]
MNSRLAFAVALCAALLLVALFSLTPGVVGGTDASAPQADPRGPADASFFDDFSSYAPGQPPAGWLLRGSPQVAPVIAEVGGSGPQYRLLSFPAVSWQYWERMALKDGLLLAAPYTVSVKMNFRTNISDRAGLTIAYNDATGDRLNIHPNIYYQHVEFWPTYTGPISSNLRVETAPSIPISIGRDYWLRVVADGEAGQGRVRVYWSPDKFFFRPVMTATGVADLTGLVGVSTAGPNLPHIFFDDFSALLANVARPPASVRGRIVDTHGNPIPDVTVADNAGHSVVTDANGNYALGGLELGTYTLTPAKNGYAFSPRSRTVNVPPDQPGQSFSGRVLPTPAPTPTPSPTPLPPKPWTFMLYLAGDNNLNDALTGAIEGLEALPQNPNVNLVVLFDGDRAGDSVRLLVQPGGAYTNNLNRWRVGEVNMGDPTTLADFVNWARAQFPAEHYYLAIADHGQGTRGVAWDSTDGNSHITPAGLRQALATVTRDDQSRIDVLHYDTCLMAMLEEASQVDSYADYMIASENLAWSVFAYNRYTPTDPPTRRAAPYVYRDAISEIGSGTTPRQLAKQIALAYHHHPLLAGEPRTISVLQLSKTRLVVRAVDTLARALLASLPQHLAEIQAARQATQAFDSQGRFRIDPSDDYLDVYDLALKLADKVTDPGVHTAARGLVDALESEFIVAEHHQSGVWGSEQVLWSLDNAHGVSIYFPARGSTATDYAAYLGDSLFAFTQDTGWGEFLAAYVGLLALPPDPLPHPDLPPMLTPAYRVFLPHLALNAAAGGGAQGGPR